MMLHQDGSTHLWVPGVYWDLIVTMDDASNEHYSMRFVEEVRFVEEEGTESSLLGVRDVLESKGLFCTFYSDRGSHYWHTPKAGGKVDKNNPTQFGVALKRLGIDMIAAHSSEARGRSERAFGTHQGQLPQKLALKGITDMAEANEYLKEYYIKAKVTVMVHLDDSMSIFHEPRRLGRYSREGHLLDENQNQFDVA